MKIKTLSVGVALSVIIMGILASGCSKESPLEPTAFESTITAKSGALSQTQFTAQVQSREESQRMLTFLGRPDTVVANQNCEITRLRNSQEEPAAFGDMRVGDSIQVFGEQNQNGFVYAYKLRIRWQSQDSCGLVSRVATMDRDRLRLTLRDCADTVLFDKNCVCVRQTNRLEIRAQLGELQVGDSVHISGFRGSDGYVYAHHFRICTSDPTGRWDIAFKDTIASIDYAAGTLTVVGRSELIHADSNTIIRGILERLTPGTEGFRGLNVDASLGGPNSWGKTFVDTILSLTDLEVGDIIQVHALFIDSSNLLATCITLVDCNQVATKKCVEFTDVLSSVDPAAKTVTFTNMPWIGIVCSGAQLVGADGAPLILEDFLSGETVAVKGFPLTGDSLKICQMTKVAGV